MSQYLEGFSPSKEVPETGTCFECDRAGSIHRHHVVPKILGGTRTIPLCEACHSKVHGRNMVGQRRLVREGLQRAKEAGVVLGRPKGSSQSRESFLAKHADVVKLLNAGQSQRHASKITGKGTTTVLQVARAMKGGRP